MWNLPNSMAAKSTIGTTQVRSIRKPKSKFPIRAPPLPKVKERAAAITLVKSHFSVSANFLWITYLRLVGNKSTITQYTVLMPKLVRASKMQDKAKLVLVESTKYNPIVTDPATSKLKTTTTNL